MRLLLQGSRRISVQRSLSVWSSCSRPVDGCHTCQSNAELCGAASITVPSAPNPTSGNLALVMEDDLMETDLTVEDAMKLVFSCGIVMPESVSIARLPRVRADGEFIDRFTIDPK